MIKNKTNHTTNKTTTNSRITITKHEHKIDKRITRQSKNERAYQINKNASKTAQTQLNKLKKLTNQQNKR